MVLRYLFKSALLPPLLQFWVLLAAWVIRKRYPKVSRGLVIFSIGSLLLLCFPWFAKGLIAWNEAVEPLRPQDWASTADSVDAIVVLSGGSYRQGPEFAEDQTGMNTLVRLRYAAHLYRQKPVPILVTGGVVWGESSEAEMMANTLVEKFSVPVQWQEREGRTTWENALFSWSLLQQELSSLRRPPRIALVTQAFHMKRSVWAFERVGFEVLPAPTRYQYTDSASRPLIRLLVPSSQALVQNRQVLHEWLGLLTYRLLH